MSNDSSKKVYKFENRKYPMDKNAVSMNEDLRGKWVIMLDSRIIAYGENIKKLFEEATKKHPKERLVLAKIPEEGTLIY